MQTPISPFYYERAVKIVKKARAAAKHAHRMWMNAENHNAPLWTENNRLRELVASLERSLRIVSAERDDARKRIEIIDTMINKGRV